MLIRGKQIADNTIGKENLSFELSYTHIQATPSTIWTVNHNLNKTVNVTVYDSTDTEIVGSVHKVDNNVIQITFNSLLTGKVEVN